MHSQMQPVVWHCYFPTLCKFLRVCCLMPFAHHLQNYLSYHLNTVPLHEQFGTSHPQKSIFYLGCRFRLLILPWQYHLLDACLFKGYEAPSGKSFPTWGILSYFCILFNMKIGTGKIVFFACLKFFQTL